MTSSPLILALWFHLVASTWPIYSCLMRTSIEFVVATSIGTLFHSLLEPDLLIFLCNFSTTRLLVLPFTSTCSMGWILTFLFSSIIGTPYGVLGSSNCGEFEVHIISSSCIQGPYCTFFGTFDNRFWKGWGYLLLILLFTILLLDFIVSTIAYIGSITCVISSVVVYGVDSKACYCSSTGFVGSTVVSRWMKNMSQVI